MQKSLNAKLYRRNVVERTNDRDRAGDGPEFEKWLMNLMLELQKEFIGNITIENT
jgi:hypothetical protein